MTDTTRAAAELCRLWSQMLGVEAGPDDDFFALGGDSITAMRMLSRAQPILGRRVRFSAFRDAPTVAALVAAASGGGDAGPGQASVGEGLDGGDTAPISKQQVSAWYAHLIAPESRAYLAESATTLAGPLDVPALRASLLAIFGRHDIYRTVFSERNGEPVQTVLPEGVLHLEEIDASGTPPEAETAFIDRATAERLPVIPDLSRLPLTNFLLIRFAADRHVLVHREHHIIHDGWSSSEFTRELIELYKQRVTPGYATNLAEPISYRAYVRAQADWLGTPEAERQLSYWRERLENAPDGVRLFGKDAASLSYRGDHLRTRFTRDEWQAFEAAAKAANVTSFVLFAAVMFLCLWRYSGQKKLSLGSGFAARGWPGADRLFGMLVNTVVLRQDVDPELRFADLVAQVDATVRGAIENEDYPFVALVEKLRADPRDERNPFINILLGFHDTPIDATPPPGLDVFKDETVPSDSTKFDLTALVVHRAKHSNPRQEVNVLWEYRSGVYERWEMEAFTASAAELVRRIGGEGGALLDTPLRMLDVTTPEQRARIAEWSQGERRPVPFAN
ncbi:MAG: condensation domain-containing protein, partial [Allosphingosinicella sp.]